MGVGAPLRWMVMSVVRGIRGATTVERDEAGHVTERVQELVRSVMNENDLHPDDIISIIFTATNDISSKFPASAARMLGLDTVPLLGAQELDVEGGLPLCIRLLAHVNSDSPRGDIHHVFLHEAKGLRVDLVH